VNTYDPEIAPDPAIWLALDEQERIRLAEAHHRAARVKLPNVEVHAIFHAMVENQIAERLEPVLRAMARLMKEGLSRHDALHAIASIVAEHLFEGMNTDPKDDPDTIRARYNAAVERLTAKDWLRQYGTQERDG
jgi:hypothetical protein